MLRTATHSGGDIWLSILAHRNTPTTGMSTSPVQRLFNRRTKTQLPTHQDLLQPEVMPCEEIQAEYQEAQAKQKEHYDKTATP